MKKAIQFTLVANTFKQIELNFSSRVFIKSIYLHPKYGATADGLMGFALTTTTQTDLTQMGDVGKQEQVIVSGVCRMDNDTNQQHPHYWQVNEECPEKAYFGAKSAVTPTVIAVIEYTPIRWKNDPQKQQYGSTTFSEAYHQDKRLAYNT